MAFRSKKKRTFKQTTRTVGVRRYKARQRELGRDRAERPHYLEVIEERNDQLAEQRQKAKKEGRT